LDVRYGWKPVHLQSVLVELIREATGSRVVGFHLTTKPSQTVAGAADGYDAHFVIPTNKLSLDQPVLADVSQIETVSGKCRMLTTSLKKIQKRKMVSKVFLNNFIKIIA
jgi:hypothetical protein